MDDGENKSNDSKYFAILLFLTLFAGVLISGGFADISPKLPSVIHFVSLGLICALPIITYFMLKGYFLVHGSSTFRYIAVLSVPSIFKATLWGAFLLLIFTAVRAILFEAKMAKLPFDAGYYATTATLLIMWFLYIGNMRNSLKSLKSNLNS